MKKITGIITLLFLNFTTTFSSKFTIPSELNSRKFFSGIDLKKEAERKQTENRELEKNILDLKKEIEEIKNTLTPEQKELFELELEKELGK